MPQDGIVEEALERDPLEDGLADHYAQDFGCHLEQFLHVLVEVELVVSGGGVAERKQVQFWTEDLIDAEVHPLPQQSSRIARLLLVSEHDLDLLVEVDGFELGVAGHEQVAPVHVQVL